MEEVKYGKTRVLGSTSFEEALARVTDALKEEGFGILTEIDVKATMKKKLDIDFREYRILGACNPPLAHRALAAEPMIGLLLPCNVVVQEVEGGSGISVSLVDPLAMFGVVENPELEGVAEEVGKKLDGVIARLGG